MFEKQLTDILNETNNFSAYYVGGTLMCDNIDDYQMVWFNIDEGRIIGKSEHGYEFDYTPEEKRLVAQIYLKNKTPSHNYYAECLKILQELNA